MSPQIFAEQARLYGRGTSPKTRCTPATRLILKEAQQMRRCPPSYEWLLRQPAIWVRDRMAAWDAIDAREQLPPASKSSHE